MSESPIFIVGCPRSGTSLLRNLLRSHPHLGFPRESHFIPDFYEAYGDPRDDGEAFALAKRILELPRMRAWGLALDPAELSNARSYGELVSRIFETWALQANKRRWGDKTPKYVLHIPTLVKIFPDCRIVHIYRDGRDVALSWLRLGDEPRNTYTAARAWKHYVASGRQAGASLPAEMYLEIRYEDLLDDPDQVLRRTCSFIDEPFSEGLLSVTLGPKKPPGAREVRVGRQRAPNPASNILSVNKTKWKTQMREGDQVVFESVAGSLLEALGYQTTGKTKPIRLFERVYWRAHHRLWWMLHRLNRRGIVEAAVKHLAVRATALRRSRA